MDKFLHISDSMKELMAQVEKIYKVDSSIVIQGETGNGKELLAREIHRGGSRAGRPFQPISCGSIPTNLMESELFGHEESAFTGATGQRIGLIESTNGGTLFLDQIGDMPMIVQQKLLRVIQDREIRRVGGSESIPIDIRVITSSNRSLGELVEEGKLREDLYYRLSVITLKIPPLRERRKDIPFLLEHFLESAADRYSLPKPEIDPKVKELLLSYNWPGNVRELENLVERLVVLGCKKLDLPTLKLELGLDLESVREATRSLQEIAMLAAGEAERKAIEENLLAVGGNKAEAARRLKVSYKTLINKAKLHGLA